MVAMAVMTWLAAMATGGMFMAWQAIAQWQEGVVAEATVQVMPLFAEGAEEARERRTPKAEGAFSASGDVAKDQAKRAAAAAAFLRGRPEVAEVRVLSEAENRDLLSPWLGRARLSPDLPLPRLIAVRLRPEAQADLAQLEQALRARVPGTRLDAHGRWIRELARMGSSVAWLGLGILLAVVVAAVILVAYAARAALESNRETIEVLHLVGARDAFIARQVERRFLVSGFLAAMAGVVATWLVFALMALLAPSAGLREAARQLLFGPPAEILPLYGAWMLIVLAATFISLASARAAAMRILNDMFGEV
jgi:cell division transport system permease protein